MHYFYEMGFRFFGELRRLIWFLYCWKFSS